MEGWALCDGQTHTYNAIDYDTPNLQGQFIMGEGSSGGESFSKGDFGGVDEIYQSQNEIGKHQHSSGTLATGSAGSHSHTYNYSIGDDDGSGISDGGTGGVTTSSGGSSTTTANPASSDGDHSHDINGNVADNSYSGYQQAMPNIPPYYVVVYLMKLK
jgi:microcystin-dependent protein